MKENMKRFNQRKLRIKMHIEAWKNRKLILSTTKQKRSSIRKEISVLQSQNPDKWSISVNYGKTRMADGSVKAIKNAGEYGTSQELLYALQLFTEKELLDETEQWIQQNNIHVDLSDEI